MTFRNWMLVVMLAPAPAMAEEVQFEGHVVEVDAGQLKRMHGARYSIPGSPAQIVGKAQICLSRADSGAGVVSVDAEGGSLLAVSRVDYRRRLKSHSVRSRLAVEAGDGGFSVAFTDFADVQGEADAEVYAPLSLQESSGWEDALGAVLKVEQGLVDCMFR